MPMNITADHLSGPAPRHKAIRVSARRMPICKSGFWDHSSANIAPIDRHCGEVRQASGHMFQRLGLQEPRQRCRAVFIEQEHFAANRRHLVMDTKNVGATFDD